jgi:acetyl esterase/lipase
MSEPTFHPDLRVPAMFLPRGVVGSMAALRVARAVSGLAEPVRGLVRTPGVRVDHRRVPGPPGDPEVPVRVFTPDGDAPARPALLWIHGGGYMLGSSLRDDELCAAFARRLGCVVVAVTYRLAPEHPFPAPIEDCVAAYVAMASSAGVDASRLVIAGASAGGGLAAALALAITDRGLPKPVLQVLVYPMLDDRTVSREAADPAHRMWDQASNRFGWASYLGSLRPGSDGVPELAAAGRRADCAGLPPAWVGVGGVDLFLQEDLAYAERLRAAGVPVTLEVVPGAFHAFDQVLPSASVSARFFDAQVAAIEAALRPAR